MRSLLISLAVVPMLLSVCFNTPALASDNLAVPTAPSIEKLLRERLADDDFRMPSLFLYKSAVLMAFRLVNLDQVSSSRWHAEIELLFDYGPPPPSIVGFDRIRIGRFRLVLNQQDERFELVRFSPIATVHPLPGGA